MLVSRSQIGGFTLIEALMSVSIVATLAVIGIPSFERLIANNRMTTTVNEFVFFQRLARSEALKRNTRVIMCPSANGRTCKKKGNWHQGWLLFVDRQGNGTRDREDVKLRVYQNLPPSLNIRSGRRHRIVFHRDGRTPGSNATFTFCDQRGPDSARAVILSNTGRSRLARQRPNGSALSCS